MSYDGELAAITGGVAPRGAPRLLDQVRGRLRLKHYSLRTEQAYLYWIRRYIRAWLPRHPAELDGAAVEAFLTGLATRDQVAASTQNQALAALLFLYREVLGIALPRVENVAGARRTSMPDRRAAARLAPWLPGSLAPWLPGSLAPWLPGSLAPWTPGPLDPWTPGPLDPWTPGPLDPWTPGPLDPWTLGPLDPWTLGPLDPWTLGPLDRWTAGPPRLSRSMALPHAKGTEPSHSALMDHFQ